MIYKFIIKIYRYNLIMSNHYILRIGDGINFKNSSKFHIWGVESKWKTFLKNVKKGDKLWFMINKDKNKKDTDNGQLIAVADYDYHNKRIIGDLISLTLTNEELEWDGEQAKKCDIEIHYNNLYNITYCNLFSNIKGQSTIRIYDDKCKEKMLINLIVEYEYIVKYSKILKNM
jgi:hypothetical protein